MTSTGNALPQYFVIKSTRHKKVKPSGIEYGSTGATFNENSTEILQIFDDYFGIMKNKKLPEINFEGEIYRR
jgi:hypothetical protein